MRTQPGYCASIAVMALSFCAQPAAAQWRATGWQVDCYDSQAVFPEDPKPCEEFDRGQFATLATFYEQLLISASQYFQGLEFPEPYLTLPPPTWPALLNKGEGAPKNVRSGPLSNRVQLGVYNCETDRDQASLQFPRNQYHLSPGSELVAELSNNSDEDAQDEAIASLWTPAHELFHAIQANRLGSRQNRCDVVSSSEIAWIVEGSAEAAASAWALKNVPQLVSAAVPGLGARPGKVPLPNYSRPLTEPADPDGYDMWHFWTTMGKELGSEENIRFLDALFRQPDLLSNKGVDAVEATLVDADSSLYDMYPQVIANWAWEMQYFDGEGDDGYEHVSVSAGTSEDRTGTVAALATKAYLVELPEWVGMTQLIVELSPADRSKDNLHLLVHKTRVDKRQGDSRNVFREPFLRRGQKQGFMVRVANVAPEPANTKGDKFDIKFEVAEVPNCIFDATVSGPNGGEYSGSARFSVTDAGFAVKLQGQSEEPNGPHVNISLGVDTPNGLQLGPFPLSTASLAVIAGGSGTNPRSYSAFLDTKIENGSGQLSVDEVTGGRIEGSATATMLDVGDGSEYSVTVDFEAIEEGSMCTDGSAPR